MARPESYRSQRSADDIFPRPRQPCDDGPSALATVCGMVFWTIAAVVILTAILVACCAPFALTFMFFRKVAGA